MTSKKTAGEKKELPEANHDELKKILYQLAHDLRNPLSGIRGFASILMKDLADRPDLQRMASYVIKGADDLNAVIDKTLKKVDTI